MKHKLKYLNLFEELLQSEIPYSEINSKGKLTITFPKSATSVPSVFNELTTEITWNISIYKTQLTQVTGFESLQSVGRDLSIEHNPVLETVTGFESLQSVGSSLSIEHNPVLETVTGFNQLQKIEWGLSIEHNPVLETVTGFNQLQSVGYNLQIEHNTALKTVTGFNQLQSVGSSLLIEFNPELTQVTGFNELQSVRRDLSINGNTALTQLTGFNQLQSVGSYLWINDNPNLVTLSIPSTLIRSVDFKDWGILFENKHNFHSPEDFVNSELVIKDCINKFNPGVHSDIVVTQILENIETWGTPATQETIINHLLSKGNYWSLIPTSIQHLAEEHYKHLYHPDFNNTGAKSVAKVATGVTYGLF